MILIIICYDAYKNPIKLPKYKQIPTTDQKFGTIFLWKLQKYLVILKCNKTLDT